MTEVDPFQALAKQSKHGRAFAARNLFGAEFMRGFKENTGYVQARGGGAPAYQRLDVNVNVAARTVTVLATIGVFNSISSSWAPRGTAAFERHLGEGDVMFVERLAQLAPKAPPEPVVRKGSRQQQADAATRLFLVFALVALLILFVASRA